jgi:hypothetical protein
MSIDTLQSASATFSGKTMTETQLTKAHAIAGILHAEIKRSGSFKEGLTDYTHAFARGERFNALRGEAIIRDIYAARYDQTLNQTREVLVTAGKNLPANARFRALVCAEAIGDMIQKAPTRPFYQAYDRAAVTLAGEFGITQNAAKTLMKETFEQHHSKDLYAHGKEIEEAYYRPVKEAEIAARRTENLQSHAQVRAMS